MKKVNKYTRAPRKGKEIFCPRCTSKTKVYHFSWAAISCQSCSRMVDKYDWFTELNTNDKIHKAFNPKDNVKWDNEYKPNVKIQSTSKPNREYTFNEISENIRKQLNKIYGIN
ncbi:MAG: hypothetical protein Unbinned3907contig1000_22 [Prokaryotic dsDNA virus sp.]|nr:MAG: hypothetical protein Unbinned3907contig1000_22 [Prokaryotic dsDNA virus sp.]|tara:strand:+ start:1592 stop:1930 length:339 start_codon:yes stop_codon:yes gene_type:complete